MRRAWDCSKTAHLCWSFCSTVFLRCLYTAADLPVPEILLRPIFLFRGNDCSKRWKHSHRQRPREGLIVGDWKKLTFNFMFPNFLLMMGTSLYLAELSRRPEDLRSLSLLSSLSLESLSLRRPLISSAELLFLLISASKILSLSLIDFSPTENTTEIQSRPEVQKSLVYSP